MKLKSILLILSFFVFVCSLFGQDTLNYFQTQNIDLAKKLKNGQGFKVYVLKDSSTIGIGDSLLIGNIASSATSTSNIIGSTITNKVYMSIWVGTFSDAVKFGAHFLSEGWKGKIFIIRDIKVQHLALSKKSQVAVYVVGNPIGDSKNVYTFSIDYGIDNGEIINPKGRMTKATALSKLKEAKELLDLDLIKQEQYDSLKAKLSPIIIKQ